MFFCYSSFVPLFALLLIYIGWIASLSQEKLAEMLDISQNALSYIEMGENFFTSETIEKLATALDVQPNEIFLFNHLDKKENLLDEIVQMLEKNPDKIQEIYKITKAITSWIYTIPIKKFCSIIYKKRRAKWIKKLIWK